MDRYIGTHRNTLTKTADANLSGGTLVKLKSGDASKVVAASASDADILGVLLDDVKSGDNVAILLFGLADETAACVAAGAISAGEKVYAAADGKVGTAPAATSSEQTAYCVGRAITPAYASGNLVEVVHCAPQKETIAATQG